MNVFLGSSSPLINLEGLVAKLTNMEDRGYRDVRGDRGRRRGGKPRERGFREKPARTQGKGEGHQPGVLPQHLQMRTPVILTKSATDKREPSGEGTTSLSTGGASVPAPTDAVHTHPYREPSGRGTTSVSTGGASVPTPTDAVHTHPYREPSGEGTTSVSTGGASVPAPTVIVKQNKPEETKSRLGPERAAYQIQRSASAPVVTAATSTGSAHTHSVSAAVESAVTGLSALRLGSQSGVSQCIKLLDENLHWNDEALELLIDQTDFLVVGVIGLQGVGKSTIMSILAGAEPPSDTRAYLFPSQSKQAQESGLNQTSGIDLVITPERVVLLDTQPLLSPAILDHLIHHDRNVPPDYTSPENCNEIQSLQIVTFLMTVCHVLLVVQDWFTDINLLRFIRTAEMLKPSSVSSHASHEATGLGSTEEVTDYYPDVVFIYNKATREDFHPENLSSVHFATSALFQHSRLRVQTGISLMNASLLPHGQLAARREDVNIHLVPVYRRTTNGVLHDNGVNSSIIPDFHGYPNFQAVLESLRSQVFAVHRQPLTHHSLTEKNWFHYGARSWETIRKSNLISEFNRLLTN